MTHENDPHAAHDHHLESMHDVLKTLVGKAVVVCNPEALCGSPTGRLIGHAIYDAKVKALNRDLLTLRTEFDQTGRGRETEPANEFIPVRYVKRVSVIKHETHIHL